eukprot:TRINITY_DN75101_c0_g1_i1.p1 TRINITY_DN75101_c0_g1~~TRINITY_DN75101_c0_g1_i1.p1  ORF type:complete len:224 (-),score=45.54 TRINITY_DN75101_c0_g1_i1:247-918(-)
MGNSTALACVVADDGECCSKRSTDKELLIQIGDMDDAKVHLNIYDLNHDWIAFNHTVSDILRVGGAFHAAIEVHGKEWSYGSEGVQCAEPRRHDVHVYRQSLLMGSTPKTEEQVRDFMEKVMMTRWHGDEYELVSHNCCNFSDAVLRNLTGRGLPPWVNRLARIAEYAEEGIDEVLNLADEHGSLSELFMGRVLSAGNLMQDNTSSVIPSESTVDSEAVFSVP